MKLSEKFDQVLPALLKAKRQFVTVKKDKKNSHLHNTYATLDSILQAVTPALVNSNLMLMQDMLESDDKSRMKVETTILHESGQWVKYYSEICIVKNDPQACGSALTYARRYAIAAALGLAQADDDAQIAMKSAEEWKRDFDRAKSVDELAFLFRSAIQSCDPASKIVIVEHKDKRKAELEAETARGFDVHDVNKNLAVDSGKESPVTFETSSQPIENFD